VASVVKETPLMVGMRWWWWWWWCEEINVVLAIGWAGV